MTWHNLVHLTGCLAHEFGVVCFSIVYLGMHFGAMLFSLVYFVMQFGVVLYSIVVQLVVVLFSLVGGSLAWYCFYCMLWNSFWCGIVFHCISWYAAETHSLIQADSLRLKPKVVDAPFSHADVQTCRLIKTITRHVSMVRAIFTCRRADIQRYMGMESDKKPLQDMCLRW